MEDERVFLTNMTSPIKSLLRAGPGASPSQSSGCLRSLSHRMGFVHQAPQPFAKFTPSPVEPASHGADRDVQDGTDLLIAAAVKVFQNHNGPVFRTKLVKGGFDNLLAFGPFQGVRRVGSADSSAASSNRASACSPFRRASGLARRLRCPLSARFTPIRYTHV